MAKLWEDYGKGSFRNHAGVTTGIAANVLSACGIPQETHDDEGGKLQGVDIKRMDAMAAIKASLFERIVDNKLLELIVTPDGKAKIIEIGANAGLPGTVYYTTQSYNYKNEAVSVMVTGGAPLPERKMGGFKELLHSTFHVKYWTADIIQGSCAMKSLKRFVTITYDDPHKASSYDDGIDNLYNITNAFESLAGYVYDIDNGTDDRYVEITYSEKATVPIKVDGLGTLAITDLAAADYTNENPECLRGIGEIAECGEGAVVLEIPSELRYTGSWFNNPIDKFLGVAGVYVVGNRISVGFRPKEEANSMEKPTKDNTGLWIAQPDTTLDIIKLTEGQNYAVAYEGDSVCIQFADRSPLDMQGLFGMGVSVRIPAWADNSTGVYTQTLDILPISETEALNVREIWAAIDVSSPCINIFDPKGDAMTIANSMSIKVAPITIVNKPAPVALNGESIDLSDGVEDHDPTTAQAFSSTQMEEALDRMNGSVGISVNMSSFTNEGDVATFSQNLHDMYDQDKGTSTIYTCGPDCDAEIGDDIGGSIVNSIEYRYNDSSSYTVSVATGPKFSSNFMASVNGGVYQKKSESVTMEGTIVADYGNGGHYSVLLEGLGRREALNSTMEVLRTGDIVTVTVHNNPVES